MENCNPNEIREIIISLWKEGKTKSEIGRILKEKYGIKDVREIFGKRLSKVLEENGIKESIPEDLVALFRKINKLIRHVEENKHDICAKKSLEELELRVKSLIKYYIRKKKLPPNFSYSREIVKMYGST